MEKKNIPPFENNIYTTGSTHPPRSHGGIVAVLLIGVIFVCGFSCALRLMNIHLFRQEMAAEPAVVNAGVVFSQDTSCTVAADTTARTCMPLGFQGCALSGLDQLLYELPQGFYVTAVTPGSTAEQLGILPGDVLVEVASQPFSDAQTLFAALEQLQPGEQLSAEIYRNGQQIAFQFTGD